MAAYGYGETDRFSFFSFSLYVYLSSVKQPLMAIYLVVRYDFSSSVGIFSLFSFLLYILHHHVCNRGGENLKIFTPQQNDDGADNVLLNDANIFPTYVLHLLDEIEKSALVLERIPSKREETDEKKKSYIQTIIICC
jgi:hypothetical protein